MEDLYSLNNQKKSPKARNRPFPSVVPLYIATTVLFSNVAIDSALFETVKLFPKNHLNLLTFLKIEGLSKLLTP